MPAIFLVAHVPFENDDDITASSSDDNDPAAATAATVHVAHPYVGDRYCLDEETSSKDPWLEYIWDPDKRTHRKVEQFAGTKQTGPATWIEKMTDGRNECQYTDLHRFARHLLKILEKMDDVFHGVYCGPEPELRAYGLVAAKLLEFTQQCLVHPSSIMRPNQDIPVLVDPNLRLMRSDTRHITLPNQYKTRVKCQPSVLDRFGLNESLSADSLQYRAHHVFHYYAALADKIIPDPTYCIHGDVQWLNTVQQPYILVIIPSSLSYFILNDENLNLLKITRAKFTKSKLDRDDAVVAFNAVPCKSDAESIPLLTEIDFIMTENTDLETLPKEVLLQTDQASAQLNVAPAVKASRANREAALELQLASQSKQFHRMPSRDRTQMIDRMYKMMHRANGNDDESDDDDNEASFSSEGEDESFTSNSDASDINDHSSDGESGSTSYSEDETTITTTAASSSLPPPTLSHVKKPRASQSRHQQPTVAVSAAVEKKAKTAAVEPSSSTRTTTEKRSSVKNEKASSSRSKSKDVKRVSTVAAVSSNHKEEAKAVVAEKSSHHKHKRHHDDAIDDVPSSKKNKLSRHRHHRKPSASKHDETAVITTSLSSASPSTAIPETIFSVGESSLSQDLQAFEQQATNDTKRRQRAEDAKKYHIARRHHHRRHDDNTKTKHAEETADRHRNGHHQKEVKPSKNGDDVRHHQKSHHHTDAPRPLTDNEREELQYFRTVMSRMTVAAAPSSHHENGKKSSLTNGNRREHHENGHDHRQHLHRNSRHHGSRHHSSSTTTTTTAAAAVPKD